MTSNIKSFGAALDKFAGDIEPKSRLIQRKIAFEALEGVVLMTPVDSGRARGNWQVSVNAVINSQIENSDKSGGGTIAAGEAVMTSTPPNSIIWLNNGLPYIDALEHGHSQKAPEGMVALTANRLKNKYGL